MMNDLKTFMGVDNNTFWNIVVTLAISIVPYIINIFKCSTMFDGSWQTKKRVENQFFYVCVFFGGMAIGMIYAIIIKAIYITNKMAGVVIGIVVGSILSYCVHKNKTVRKNILLLNKRWKRILIFFPFTIFPVFLFCEIWLRDFLVLRIIYILLFVTFEYMGFDAFKPYIKYMHSYMRIVTRNAGNISDIDTDSVYKRGKWLIFTKENNKHLVLFSDIVAIEYYGNIKVIDT